MGDFNSRDAPFVFASKWAKTDENTYRMTEHEPVEVLQDLSVVRMIPKVGGLVPVPVKLRGPDGQVELLPEQVQPFLHYIPVEKEIT